MGNRGSSPLTRGKRPPPRCRLRNDRLIPAHAGKTRSRKLEQLSARAHPRSRGENNIEAIADQAYIGSSPLTRGKPLFDDGVRDRERLIPAHAGKTWMRARTRSCDAAHPRSRGENTLRTLRRCTGLGSSPLTRGKRGLPYATDVPHRLIPAHAGKTAQSHATRRRVAAHPRSRGENATTPMKSVSAGGSSPLTRGKPRNSTRRFLTWGLIPAHAGKTGN